MIIMTKAKETRELKTNLKHSLKRDKELKSQTFQEIEVDQSSSIYKEKVKK